MKRKLSMFLAICMMLSCITPALDAKAASTALQEVQTVVENEAADEGVYENADAEEDIEISEEVIVEEDTEASKEEIVEEGTEASKEETVEEDAEASKEEIVEEDAEASEEEIVEEDTEASEEEIVEEDAETSEEIAEEEIVTAEVYNSAAATEEGFSGKWGADDADVSVRSYPYGADLLFAEKDYEWYNGITYARGVLIVESGAEVDLVQYADGVTRYDWGKEKSVIHIADVEITDADGSKRTTAVRYMPIDSTTQDSFYMGDVHVASVMYRISGLEPETSYSYLPVSWDYLNRMYPIVKEEFEPVVRSFTTKEAYYVQPTVSLDSITAYYSCALAEISYSNLYGQDVLEVGLTSETYEDTYTTSFSSEPVTTKENLPGGFSGDFIYYDWSDKATAEHPFTASETTKIIKPYIVINEYTEDGYVEKRYEGQGVEVTAKDLSDFTVKSSNVDFATRSQVDISTLFGNVGYDGDLAYLIAYREKGTEEWKKSKSYQIRDYATSISVSNLTADTEYEYEYQIIGWSREGAIATLPGGTFRTEGEPITLTQADIPDESLWRYFARDNDSISSADLLEYTDLYIYESHVENYGPIRDLTGIEYLKNLNSIILSGQELTNITPLLACEKLKKITLQECGLTDVIDFSGLENLTTLNLNYNHITNEKLADLKYPEGTNVSTKYQTPAVTMGFTSTLVCRESADSEKYVIPVYLKGAGYSSYIYFSIEDITDADNVITVYPKTQTSVNRTYCSGGEMYNSSWYEYTANIVLPSITEGERVLRFNWHDGSKTYSKEIAVNVDPDAVGVTWEIPDEEFPAALKKHMLSNWTMEAYDTNNDGKYSYAEIAAAKELYINNLGLTDYSFIKYMPSLTKIEIRSETTFSDQLLKDLCDTVNAENLKTLNINYMSQITDISCLSKLVNLTSFTAYGSGKLNGLQALKKLPLTFISVGQPFDNAEVFDFICNKSEVTVKAAGTASLVSTAMSMIDTTDVSVEIEPASVAAVADNNKFKVYGLREGKAKATMTYQDMVREVDIIVTAADFDYDPPLGEIVPEADRMKFAGTEGIENARVSRSLVDSDDNIWNISTRTPEKVLTGSEYTKYAARIIYNLKTRFSTLTNSANADYSMYLDKEGTLWAYSKNDPYSSSNFKNRIEVMRDVADWQDGGYTEDPYHGYSGDEYLLILRTDGSLWYMGYDSWNNMLSPTRLEKLEESGTVKSIHTHSYLTKDGRFYKTRGRTYGEMEIKLIADGIVNVWDNTALTIVQDAEGNYYNSRGRLDIQGTIEEFLVGNYWNPQYKNTGHDLIASYLLMDDGKLYRSYNSDWDNTEWKLFDENVTAVDKDYYWKGDTAYAFTKSAYTDYLGSGAGKGLYPVEEADGTMTLYVNGVPYLTKVSDWTMGDACVYAVRIDNTLWWFDENTTPTQIDLSELKAETKDSPKDYTEIDIKDLKIGTDSIQLTWTALEGASSYQVFCATASYGDEVTSANVTGNSYTITGLSEGDLYNVEIAGLDANGETVGASHRFRVYTEEPKLTIDGIEVSRGTKNSSAEIKVSVGPESLKGNYKLTFYITSGAWNSESGNWEETYDEDFDLACSGSGSYKKTLSNLPNDLEYDVEVVLSKDNQEITRKYSDFDTILHTYLTEAQIPDAAFRERLRNYSDDLDLYELNRCPELYIGDPNIKSLKGLELLTGLKYLYMENLQEDAVKSAVIPTSVEYLMIRYCGLTKIPDVSKLSNLEDFELYGNRIPETEFYANNPCLKTFVVNYNEPISYWLSNQARNQFGDPVEYISSVYYKKTNGTYPFILEIGKVDGRHEYQMDIYEGGTKIYVVQATDYGSSMRACFKIANTGIETACTKTWEIVVTDLTDDKEIYHKTKEIEFADSAAGKQEVQYVPAVFESLGLVNPIYLTEEQGILLSEVENWTARVKDSEGKVYKMRVNRPRKERPEEYNDFWNVEDEDIPISYYVTGRFDWSQEEYKLASGKLVLEFLDASGNVLVSIEDLLMVTEKPYIYDVSCNNWHFNNQGEYVFVNVYGYQLGNKFPEIGLYGENGEKVYIGEPELVISDQYSWKFHLAEEYRTEQELYYRVIGQEYAGSTTGELWLNRDYGYVYNLYKDMTNGGIIGYASSEMRDGTVLILDVETWDGDRESVKATVNNGKFFAKLKTKGCLESPFVSIEIYSDDREMEYGYMSASGEGYVGEDGSGSIFITTNQTDAGWYFYSVLSAKKTNVVVRNAQTGVAVKQFTMPANGRFEDADLAGLNAGELYMVNASNEDGYYTALGMFNLETKTKDLRFSFIDHEGEPILELAENQYRIDYSAAVKNKVFTLNVQTAGNAAAGITATSSNAAVAAVKVKGNTVSITMKAAGTADIKVVAKDSKYTETITLDIRDYTPRIENTVLALNKAVSRRTETNVYPVYHTEITDVVVNEEALTAKEVTADYVNYFAAVINDAGKLKVILLDDSQRVDAKGKPAPLKNGSYRLPLIITTEEPADSSASGEVVERQIEAVVTVKLSNTKPKVTVKQTEKINSFYTDTKAVFTVIPNVDEIRDISLVGEGEEGVYFAMTSYDLSTGEVVLEPTDLGALNALKGAALTKAYKVSLNITVGETSWQQAVTIGRATTKPSIALDLAASKIYQFDEINDDGIKETVYAGKTITFTPIDKKTKIALENIEVIMKDHYKVSKQGDITQNFSDTPEEKNPEGFLDNYTEYTLEANEDGSYTIYFVGTKNASASIYVQGDNWADAIKLTHKATVTKAKITAKLSSAKVTLNKNYEDQKTVLVTSSLPDAAFALGDVVITPPNKKVVYTEGDIQILQTEDGTGIAVAIAPDNTLVKGTYKATIPLKFTFADGVSYEPKALTLSISVIDTVVTTTDLMAENPKAKVNAVKWKAAGKVDAIARETGVITLTPTVSLINAVVSAVDFSDADKNLGLDQIFTMDVVDGKVVLRLNEGVSVSTKDKFKINPVVTLMTENGKKYESVATPVVNVTPTQSAVKMTLDPKQATMYQYSAGTHTAGYTYTLKAAEGVQVSDVTLKDAKVGKKMMSDYFRVIYDYEEEMILVTLIDDSIPVKTYTLNLQVTFADQTSNAKPLNVSTKIVIKK